MASWRPPFATSKVHLASESGAGATSLALHMALRALEDGKRVLWAAPEMPDPARFAQVIGGLPPTTATRFHAMNLVGRMDLVTKSLLQAATSLPGVGLVVMDDWAPATGRIPAASMDALSALAKGLDGIPLLATTKLGTNMDAEDGFRVRGKERLDEAGFESWRMVVDVTGVRRLEGPEEEQRVRIVDEGLETV
ncbi:MAG: hypothetical protein L7U48_05380 [Candidatus Poseidoniaceae archaeon]|nr:hypothetical protein [Candidatus Poseidoniaceae archaeon]